jgi:hypothetical protein
MRRIMPPLAVVALALTFATTPAIGATITFSGFTSATGRLNAGTTLTIGFPGLAQMVCTSHSINAAARDLNTTDPLRTTPVASVNTSLMINGGADNAISGCTYTVLGSSGNATLVTGGWRFTATTTTTAALEILDRNTTTTLTTGPLAGCVIILDSQAARGFTLSSRTGPTAIEITANRARVRFVTTRCFGITGTSELSERLTINTVSVSPV